MVRFADLKDAGSIAEMEKQYIECAWTKEMIENSFSERGYKFFVFESDGEVAGYCGVKTVFSEAEFLNIATRASFRSKGVATALLNAAHEYCKSENCRFIELEVNSENAAAISLYEKSGYKTVRVRKNYYKSGDALIMQKSLCQE